MGRLEQSGREGEGARHFGPEQGEGKVKKPVWKTPDPTKGDKKLTPAKKASAKAMAKAAGRPYPNLVDNMRAARKGK